MTTPQLNAFIGKVLGDLGGGSARLWCSMGEKFGLYKALKRAGSHDAGIELATKTNRR